MTLKAIEEYLHQKIPLSKAMGVKVMRYDGGELELHAPLDVNHNHLGTAFGGSLSALATLTAYALLWLELADRDAHVVIKESAVHYRKPVTEDLRAICYVPEREAFDDFKRLYERKGKARIELKAAILNGESVAMEFVGTFVAIA